MGKMWIRQVKAIRNDGNASTIDLQQGLNCIIGPSNTGKTGIAKTISFVCGGNVIPFTDVTGYAGASVTFSTEHGEVTLQRSLASQTIQVSSTDSDVEPGDYTVARRGKNKRPINSVLLTMLDVDEARRIAVNEAYRTVAFTWNAIRHLLLVPEDQIVRPEPSILLPKTTSNTTMTQNLSALLVLAQDETFNDEARQESSAERHARRQAVERFIFSQLDIIEPRIKQLEQLERDAATEGKTVDSYIEKLRNTLQHWKTGTNSARRRALHKNVGIKPFPAYISSIRHFETREFLTKNRLIRHNWSGNSSGKAPPPQPGDVSWSGSSARSSSSQARPIRSG